MTDGEQDVQAENEEPPDVEERPSGWYPDPFGRLRHRWWDGERWSAYAATTNVQWDPAPVEEVAPLPPGLPTLGPAIAGVLVGFGLSLAIAGVFWALDDPGGEPTGFVASQLGLWTGWIGACIFVSRRRGTKSLVRDFGFRVRPVDVALGLLGAVASRIAAVIMISPLAFLLRRVEPPESDVFGDITAEPNGWLAVILVVAVGAPLVEELFFRGLLQPRLVRRWGVGTGIAVTSVLFGAAHLTGWQGPVTLVYALSIVGVGAVLGMLRHYTGRLGPGIVAHAMLNAQALIVLALID